MADTAANPAFEQQPESRVNERESMTTQPQPPTDVTTSVNQHSGSLEVAKTAPPSAKKPRNIIRSIHRHHRLLMFIGALIVFSTFIVKDTFREQLRDLVESIDKAEGIYLLRNEFIEIRRQMAFLEEEAGPNQGKGLGIMEADTELGIFATPRGIWTSEKLQSVTIENTKWLLERLPRDIQDQETTALKAILASDRRLSIILNDIMAHPTPTSKDIKLSLLRRAEEELTMERKLNELADKVLKQAREVKEANERRYKICTWASWFLYALGWGLGLAGRLVGVEGIGGNE